MTFFNKERLFSDFTDNNEKPHFARQFSIPSLQDSASKFPGFSHFFPSYFESEENQENEAEAELNVGNSILTSSAKYAGSNGRGRMLKVPHPASFQNVVEKIDRMQGVKIDGPIQNNQQNLENSRFSQGTTYSTFNRFNFDGSIPETFDFATVNDPVFQAMSSHEITALNSGDNKLYEKVYKHKQLTYISLWSASSPKNKITGKEKYENPSYGLITEYGCWCLPNQYSNFTAGYGTPLDKIDTACRDRSLCARCATSEFSHCDATNGYQFETFQDISGKRGIKCDKNPINSCQRALCECDAAFVDSVGDNYLNWDEKLSANSGKFDRKASCGANPHVTTTTKITTITTTTTTTKTPATEVVADDYFDWMKDDASTFDASDYSNSDYYENYDESESENDYGFIEYEDEKPENLPEIAAVSVNQPTFSAQSQSEDNKPSEQQNFEDLFGDYAGIDSDLIDADSESESGGMPDHNLVFNPLTGKWEQLLEDDIIYDQFNYDDVSEQHDGDVSHYLYFPPHVVSRLKVSSIGDSVDQTAVKEVHSEWSGKLLNVNKHDPNDYSSVHDYYYNFDDVDAGQADNSSQNRGIFSEHQENLQEIHHNSQTCCGEYPRRFPYHASPEKKCCRFGTFNPKTHSCCGDHVLLGSSCF